ncbi:MAG: thioredoxin-disulfide reductase [Patescibacteria group bacterium]|nr:thioredoxin-disulfide reductase [Patescibacteria group bacterium]
MHNLIIIGSGPAGYTAGIYAGRAGLKPVVFTGVKSGGQLMNTSLVENWPGAKDGIMGPELMMNMRDQAIKFGAKVIDKTVSKVELEGEVKKIFVGQEKYEAKAVIVATGAEAIMLGVPGEKELMGKGVAVCAVCDAPFYKDKVVFVIGGGNAAVIDAIALTKFAKKVYLVHRRDKLRASKIMIKRVMDNSKIEVLWNTELKEIKGEGKVEEVVLFSGSSTNSSLQRSGLKGVPSRTDLNLKADGVFLAIGHKPMTELFKGDLELNKKGYIKTKMYYPEVPRGGHLGGGFGLSGTSVEGVFAAGDVVDFKYQQAITASAMGCQAALDAEKWLEKS